MTSSSVRRDSTSRPASSSSGSARASAGGAVAVAAASAVPEPPQTKGRVIFVGTGPGDPDLLTLGAVAALAEATTVILDREPMSEILAHRAITVPAEAQVVTLGVADNGRPLPPSARARTVLKYAGPGTRVVRLVAGDPFLDNGVADEAAACVRRGIDFEVVPGVSSLTAVPEYAGVALHHSAGVHFVQAMDGRFSRQHTARWAAVGTMVVSTRAGAVAELVAAALAAGRPECDSAMVTFRGGSTEQQTTVTTLVDLAAAIGPVDADEPVHVMLGVTEDKRDDLAWFETKPLFGWRVLVPRTKDQAAPLSSRLRNYGAHPEEVPTISVEPPRSPQQMDRAVRGLVEGRYEWVAFTSVNAVKAVREKFESYGLDARAFSGLKVATVGDTTAAALQAWGIEPDLVPEDDQSAAGLLGVWPPYDDVLDPINRVFLPRADIATETLSAGLIQLGWEVDDVTAYRTVRAAPPSAEVRDAIKAGRFDAVVFTSSSTVRNLVGIAGKPHPNTVIAVIGPATAKTAIEHGLRVDVQSSKPSAVELADVLAAFAGERRDDYVARGEAVVKPSQLTRPHGRNR